MQIDLFNQALLLIVAFFSFLALAYGFLKNPLIHPVHQLGKHKQQPNSRLWIHLLVISTLSVLFGFGAHAVVQAQFPQDSIPLESVVWAMPLGATIVLLGYNFRSLWTALVSTAGIVFSAALMLLLANNYYHYYPTLDALFDHSQVAAVSDGVAKAMMTPDQTVQEDYYQPLAHQSLKGELKTLDIPASGAFHPRQGRIYLPQALHGNDMIKLPVIVLLAGYPGKPLDWEQAGLLTIMDSFALKHKGLAPIVAVVDFEGDKGVDTECVNSKLGDSETYVTKDVPSYLKAHYPVSKSSTDWVVGGYSAGGMCGTLLALRNPSVYQNFINVSGDTYPSLKTPADTQATLFNNSQADQDAHTPDLLLKKGNPLYKTMNGWYFVGQQDNQAMIKRTRDQEKLASNAGITVKEKSMSGHHSFLVWKEGYVESLPWMMNQLRLTVSEK